MQRVDLKEGMLLMLKKLNGIRLVRFEPEYHTAKLYEWYYSGDYQEFFRDYPECPSATEIALAAQNKTFMVVREYDSLIVGLIKHFKINEASRNFELGALIDTQYQNSGASITALKIMLNWKFNSCNFYKAKMKILARNKRLCDILNKFGAVQEGVLKKDSFLNGKFQDVAAYAIFKTNFNQLYSKDFEQEESRLEPHVISEVA